MIRDSEISKIYENVIVENDRELIDSHEYQTLRHKIDRNEDKLKELIGKEKFKQYENFMEDYYELSELCNEYYFIKGFSKANKLRDEALMR